MSADELLAALKGARRVLLTGPEDLDGDSIGACLALQRICRQVSDARVDVAGDPGFRYRWMAGAQEMVPDAEVTGPYDLALVLDGDRNRLHPQVGRAFAAATRTGIIDHHGTTSAGGYDLAVIDRAAASTCGMVMELMQAWGAALDPTVAELLYAGVIFDTGGFRYSNTSAATHRQAALLLDQGIDHAQVAVHVLMERRRSGMRMQARVMDTAVFHAGGSVVQGEVTARAFKELNANAGDVEGIVDAMVYVEGVEVAALLIERAPEQIKVSLRSRGAVNVASLARALSPGGGGHAKAAGLTLPQPMSQVRRELPLVLGDAVRVALAGEA